MKEVDKAVIIPYEKYRRLIEKRDSLTSEDILKAIPEVHRKKARAILHFVSKDPSLSWNDKGELVLGNQAIDGSRIVDLLKYSQNGEDSSVPKGYDEFHKGLKASGISISSLGKMSSPKKKK